jgi:hypothetical protein
MKSVVEQLPGLQTVVATEGENLITGTVQDCTPILEDAKARHNAGFHGSSDMKHAARLPMVLIEKYCNLNGITFAEWMQNPVHGKRMLSDPDLSEFRIWKGQVGRA